MLAGLHHGPSESRRPGSNGPRRGGSPVLFRLSYVREMRCEHARLESNQRPLPSRGSALSTELRAWGRSLRQDSNPHLGRTTGACLPLTLRRRTVKWRCRESNPILLGASEALSRLSFIPEVMRTGGVEPPQREALALQAGELADAQRPRERGGRPDSNRRRGDHDPECFPLHHGHSGDGRARTGNLSPDKRALWPSELRPRDSRAGGIRTHGLELMRLARTTAPLPRKVWLAGLEPAIPGFQGRWGGQLPHSQMTNVVTRVD